MLSKVKIKGNVKLGMPMTPHGKTLPNAIVSSIHWLAFCEKGVPTLPKHLSCSPVRHYLGPICSIIALLDSFSTVVQSWCSGKKWENQLNRFTITIQSMLVVWRRQLFVRCSTHTLVQKKIEEKYSRYTRICLRASHSDPAPWPIAHLDRHARNATYPQLRIIGL